MRKINIVFTIILKKLFVMFTIVAILISISEAREVGICEASGEKSIILAYQDNGKTLIIDGKYTAKLFDGDIIYNDKAEEALSYDAYRNKKYAFYVETYYSYTNNKIKKQIVRVFPSKYIIINSESDQNYPEIVYTCKWHKE